MTKVDSWPIWRCMSGPYWVDKSRKRWCGRGWRRNWWRFPIIGSFGGPGGSFLGVGWLLFLSCFRMSSAKRSEMRRMEKVSMGMCTGVLGSESQCVI